jgi:hypothetical protein
MFVEFDFLEGIFKLVVWNLLKSDFVSAEHDSLYGDSVTVVFWLDS